MRAAFTPGRRLVTGPPAVTTVDVDPAEVIGALAFHRDGRPRTPADVHAIIAELTPEDAARIGLAARYTWKLWARPKQLEPEGAWRWWLMLSGRAFGKTRGACEATLSRIASGRARRVGLVGRDARQVREVMVEGPDGILARSAPWMMPRYEPSKTRITWPNGAVATTLTADEPDSLRGPSFDWMWLEEVASWRYPEAFHAGAELCLRIGLGQGVIGTTPKPVPLIRDLVLGTKDPSSGRRTPRPDVVIVRGSTFENEGNLSRAFLDALRDQYEGTNIGRQELYAELLDDLAGALWTYALIERNRVPEAPALPVLVVAIDPTRSPSGAGDECGLVIGGLGEDGHAYILADRSLRGSPDAWAREAVKAYYELKADRLTYEGNFSREVVRQTLGTIDGRVKLKEVIATRGKIVRAEPVSALYEQGKVHHVGMFPKLEDELTSYWPGAPIAERSPSRLDALVWLVTDLLLEPQAPIVAPVSVGSRRSPWKV